METKKIHMCEQKQDILIKGSDLDIFGLSLEALSVLVKDMGKSLK